MHAQKPAAYSDVVFDPARAVESFTPIGGIVMLLMSSSIRLAAGIFDARFGWFRTLDYNNFEGRTGSPPCGAEGRNPRRQFQFRPSGYSQRRSGPFRPSELVAGGMSSMKKNLGMRFFQKSVIFERASGVFLTRCKCMWHKGLSKNSSCFVSWNFKSHRLLKFLRIMLFLSTSSLALTGCTDPMDTPFNHILDAEMVMDITDYFETNNITRSIGSSGVISVVEYDGKYIAVYGSSGPLLSASTDLGSWKHYPDGELQIAPSKLVAAGSVLLSDAGGSIMVVTSMGDDLTYAVYPPPREEISEWKDLAFYGGTLYALWEKGLYRSGDYGKSWRTIDGSYLDCQAIAVDRHGIYLVQGGGLWMRTDQGWTDLGYSGATAIYSDGEQSFLAQGGEIRRSDDGFQTSSVFATVSNLDISALYRREDHLLVANDQEVYHFLVSTAASEQIHPLGQTEPALFPKINDLYIAADETFLVSTQGGLWISTDSGQTWKREIHYSGFLGAGAKAFHVAEESIYVVTTSGEVQSKQSGTSWTKLELPLDLRKFDCHSIFPFKSNIYISNGFFLSSSKDGKTWSTPTGLFANNEGRSFAFDDTHIYAATSTGVFRSADKGATWGSTANSDDVEKVFHDGTYLYAWNGEKMSLSSDQGDNWIADRLPLGGTGKRYSAMGQLGKTTYIGREDEILSSTDGFSSSQPLPNAQGATAFLAFDGILWMKIRTDDAGKVLGRISQEGGEISPITLRDLGGFKGDSLAPQADVILSIQANIFWISDGESLYFSKITRPSP